MNQEEQAVKLAEVEQRAKSNTRRIDKLEQSTDALNRLATSVEVMATKQDQIAETVDRLDGKVSDIEGRPGKRWESIVDKIIWAIAGGVIAFLLSQIGIR